FPETVFQSISEHDLHDCIIPGAYESFYFFFNMNSLNVVWNSVMNMPKGKYDNMAGTLLCSVWFDYLDYSQLIALSLTMLPVTSIFGKDETGA
ncbi:hypothetical protein ACJX0J_026280, partial [Zea mays]